MNQRGESSLCGRKLGPYLVHDRLGQGGMGAVYLAVDTALDRKVAIKTLLPRHADDPEFIARFQREARASARLSHPNIVQIYTVDIESDPAYMAMEYIEGESLESRIRRAGPLPWRMALTLVSQVASALDCAHAAGIVHRDIKPANILIDGQGRARVTDFGIAKVLGSQTNLTGTQHTVGSPCYMSPEQCGKGEVGPASDLFSLGIMLFEMLVGKVPFTGESSLAVMKQITEEDLPALATVSEDVPQAVQQILNTLASRDPAFRYATAGQVLADLRAFQAGSPLHHAQSLGLQRAAQAPASASAADITRSPTAPRSPAYPSLVDEILDATPRKVAPVRAGWDFEVPWTGVLVTGMLILFAALGTIYYREVASRPRAQRNAPLPAAVEPAPEAGFRPPRPGDPGFRPNDGARGGRRSQSDSLPPRFQPRDGGPPPPPGFPPPRQAP